VPLADMYAPHVMDEFVGITSDFFTYGEEVDIAKCEAFIGLCHHPPSQSTQYRWGHLCDAMSNVLPRWKLVFDKRGPPAQATWCRQPYRLWWSSFVKNMYCAYERQPSDAQIEQCQTNNVRWQVLWIDMFSKPAHALHANVRDSSIIGKCFTPYCHTLVRHWDVFFKKIPYHVLFHAEMCRTCTQANQEGLQCIAPCRHDQGCKACTSGWVDWTGCCKEWEGCLCKHLCYQLVFLLKH